MSARGAPRHRALAKLCARAHSLHLSLSSTIARPQYYMAENEASRGGEAERIESGSWKVGTHVPNYSCARSPAWNGVLTLCGARARARCPAPCALPALTALPPFRLTSTAKIGRTTSTRTSSARPSRAHENRAQVRNCFFKEAAEGLRRGLARAAPLTSTARSPLHAATPVLYHSFFPMPAYKIH